MIKSKSDDYIPFGEEWEKHMTTLPKKFIIGMLRDCNQKRQELEASQFPSQGLRLDISADGELVIWKRTKEGLHNLIVSDLEDLKDVTYAFISNEAGKYDTYHSSDTITVNEIINRFKKETDESARSQGLKEEYWYCKEVNFNGYKCEEQCPACKKADEFDLLTPDGSQGLREALEAIVSTLKNLTPNPTSKVVLKIATEALKK